MWVREGECNQCGKCCETVNLTVARDVALRQHGNVQELERYLSFRGIRLAGEDIENNFLFYSLDIPCSQLAPDKRCLLHNRPEKPFICLRYPTARDDIEECSYTFKQYGTTIPGP